MNFRAAPHLLVTYTQTACSRGPTASASATFVAKEHSPGGERQRVSLGASLLRVHLMVVPDPLIVNLKIHIYVGLRAHTTHTHLILFSDGTLRAQDAGGGTVLAAPLGAVILRAWFDIRA